MAPFLVRNASLLKRKRVHQAGCVPLRSLTVLQSKSKRNYGKNQTGFSCLHSSAFSRDKHNYFRLSPSIQAMMNIIHMLVVVAMATPVASLNCGDFDECRSCDQALDTDGNRQCEWCVRSQSCVGMHFYNCFMGSKITEVGNCPEHIHKGDNYNDTFARGKMLAICAAAYWDDPQPCLTNHVDDAQVVKQVIVPCDASSNTTCSAFTALSLNNSAIILSFRGTYNGDQLWIEGWDTLLDNLVDIVGGGKVSKYFFDAFNSVWNNGIRQSFMKLVADNEGLELWITGHSLGAAMASVASNIIAAEGLFPSKMIKLVTYGQPRVGDYPFAVAHDRMIGYSYRVVHARDMVPHLAPLNFRGYQHHRYEVWYDNDMAPDKPFQICLTPDNGGCSDSEYIDGSAYDHLHYFQRSISWWGQKGCLEKVSNI